MLKAQEIVNGLQTIVNEYSIFAIMWHVILYALIIALFARWEPSNRLLGTLMCIPLLSVAIFAWIYVNPFNGILFSIAALLTLVFGLMTSAEPINLSQLIYTHETLS